MTALWTIRMLGGLSAHRGGHDVAQFRSHKTGSLLAYLAYHLNQDVSRDVIVETMWPDADLDRGRHSLRQALVSLRRQFEPPDIAAGSVIISDHSRIRLNGNAVSTDVRRFRRAGAKAKLTASAEGQLEALRKALPLYAGELLPGFFDEWVRIKREHLSAGYVSLLRTMISVLKSEGRSAEALEYAMIAANVSPDREELQEELISLEIELGLDNAAICHFLDFQERMQREFDLKIGSGLSTLMLPFANRLSRSGVQLHRPLPHRNRRIIPVDAAMPNLSESQPPGIPAPLNQFFGRADELSRIVDLLVPRANPRENMPAPASARLVTIVGMGGCGKTRLAVEAGIRLQSAFESRTLFVSLANLASAADVIHAVVNAFALPPSRAPEYEQVCGAINDRSWLILMDNCEHLLPGAGYTFERMLQDLPHLSILATSRTHLDVPGEHVMPLMPLAVPKSTEAVMDLYAYPGVQMLISRAQEVTPDFQVTRRNASVIAAIAERLEGVPLAIELAAAHAHSLTPNQMLVRLADRFNLLVSRRARDKRHVALLDAIDWSYDLLPPRLQRFFLSLSVFRGTFTAEAAENVCEEKSALAMLEELVERSLLLAEPVEESMRFWMLESLREYATARAESPFVEGMAERHAGYYLSLAQTNVPNLHTGHRQKFLRSLDADHGNILAAVEHVSGRVDEVKLVCAIWRYWDLRGYIDQGLRLLERALLVQNLSESERAGALHGLGVLRERRDDVLGAEESLRESLSNYTGTGDSHAQARVLNSLAIVMEKRGDLPAAHAMSLESLALLRASGDEWDIAACLNTLGRQCRQAGDIPGTLGFLSEALGLYERLEDWGVVAATLHNLGCVYSDQNELGKARAAFERSLALFRDIDQPAWTAFAVHNLGDTKERQGDLAGARTALLEALSIRTGLADRSGIAATLEVMAKVAFGSGEAVTAVHLVAAADGIRHRFNTTLGPVSAAKLEQVVSKFKLALTDADFEAAWSFGSAMSLDSATLYATEGRLISRTEDD